MAAEESLKHLSELIDIAMAKTRRKVEIAMDEWNVTNGWGVDKPVTLKEGLFVAGMFNVLHRLCSSVTLGNLTFLTNMWGPIFTSEE